MFIIVIVAFLAYLQSKINTPIFENINKNVNENAVGGDLDEHGCKPLAGYTWCETKQKCLRVWEEPCEQDYSQEEVMIKAVLVEKNGWNADEISVGVLQSDGTYAMGAAGPTEGGPGGGAWFAKKVDGQWKIVWDGNGSIMCSDLKDYPDFPNTMIPECYDQTTGNMVQR